MNSKITLLVLCMSLLLSSAYAQDPAMFKLAGFASLGNGTTGGAGGDTIKVSTGNALQDALDAKKDNPAPLVILVEGLINEANSAGLSKIDVKEVNDVTILGAEGGAEFFGIGLKVRRASNIIIRNLKVHHVVIGEGDCIGIEGPADHIWVDHCELYNEYEGVDKDYYDGLLDAKADCEYITYSWNFLHDSWKTSLVGSSETDTYDRKITMHHNYYLNCNSRLPLFRGSTGHFFNNYYKDIASTTINSRINACVRIENNYFENANNPWVSAYSDILGGGEPIGNILVNSPFQYFPDTHELPFCAPSIPYDYSEVLHDAEHVPALVMNFAGVGKLGIPQDPVYLLSSSVSGSGSISREPDKPFYDSGEEVTVTAAPDTYWEFDSWSGDLSGSENPKTLVMDGHKSISALFTTDKLTLDYSASGPGTVSVTPDLAMYDPGATVSITAIPAEGAYFSGWSGDLSGTVNPYQFAVDSNMQVTAIFKYESAEVLDIQFEEEYCALQGSVETEHDGYTGSGFVDFENATGSSVSLAIDATESMVCSLELRYAHGKTDDRSMDVKVNGVNQVAGLDFPPTGAFTTWDTVKFELTLAAGFNLIEWTSLTSNGGPNFDKVDIIANASVLSRTSCEEEPEVINAPSSLSVEAVSLYQLDLSWIDQSDNESGFIIERKEEDGTFTEIADLGADTEAYSDDQLAPASTYYYRVKAYGLSGSSSWSNTGSATTLHVGSPSSVAIEDALFVYPNPVSGRGHVDLILREAGEVCLSLISITGSKTMIYKGFVQGGTMHGIPLNLDQFSEGIYLFEMISGDVRIVKRIVIIN